MANSGGDHRTVDTLELSLTSKDEPIRFAMQQLLQCPSQKKSLKRVHVHYDTNVLSRALYGQLASVGLTERLFQELRTCPMIEEFRLSLRPEGRIPIHYVNATTTVRPMSLHFSQCRIGDFLQGHSTLQKVDLVLDYHYYTWAPIIRYLSSCPNLTQVTIQFAIEGGTPQCLPIPIGDLVAKCTSLTRLLLEGFPYLGFNFERLMKALTYHQRMTELSITTSCDSSTWDQAITPNFIDAVVKAVVANQSLQILELPIDLSKALPILNSLHLNRSLRMCRLLKRPNNDLPEKVTKFLTKLDSTRLSAPPPSKNSSQKKIRLPLRFAGFLTKLPTTIKKTKNIADYDDPGDPTPITFYPQVIKKSSMLSFEESEERGLINTMISFRDDVKFVYHLLATNPSLMLHTTKAA